MMTPTKTAANSMCQNCYAELNKEKVASNFCCQECFDEWLTKQQMKVINAFNNYIGVR